MTVTSDDDDKEAQILALQRQVVELEARTKTTLTGAQFLVILLVGPLFLAFVSLGVIIVWKTTSSPETVAPHLDIILVAFAIFATPVTSAAASIVGAVKGGKDEV